MFSANENILLRQHKKRVVDYVEATIPDAVLDLGVSVMAMQVNCTAPGCVPIETAIVIIFPASATELLPGLTESAGGSYKTKVLKPMAAVVREDVLDALPPAFAGGTRSVERLLLQSRDVMLGQITQMFGEADVGGRRLMAEYLMNSLQEYVDHSCVPPELGEAFPVAAAAIAAATAPQDDAPVANAAAATTTAFRGTTGNLIVPRPIDDEGTSAAAVLNAPSNVTSLSTPASIATAPKMQAETPQVSVNSITKLRRQQAAVNSMMRNANSQSNLLSRLSSREHAPGVRRPACPCCDPDHPASVVDRLLSQL